VKGYKKAAAGAAGGEALTHSSEVADASGHEQSCAVNTTTNQYKVTVIKGETKVGKKVYCHGQQILKA
jgi:hypothetical protein